MPTVSWIPTIKKIANGSEVEADVVNPILNQLAQREQYLFERFGELEDKSIIIAYDQAVHIDDELLIVPGSIVYFKDDGVNKGIALAKAEFTSSGFSSFYSPNNSSFIFGIVKSVSGAPGNKRADVYVQGLVELANDIDDPSNGMLESTATFAVGPYFLSRRESGKLSLAPGGVAVFVGFAIDQTHILLNPRTEELFEFFLHYRFNILDRPNGTPVLTGTTWTVTSPDVTSTAINRVGWIGVADIPTNIVPPASVPSGALFFYGLPADLTSSDSVVVDAVDNPGISADERTEAREAALALPPYPADFTYLLVNGIAQLVRSSQNPAGIFTIDQFGLWWYNDQDGSQPWASDIGSGVWVPTDWPSTKGSDFLRPRLMLQFLKFNPDLRSVLVTSLRGFSDNTNDSTNVLKFYDSTTGLEARAGDLLAKFNLPIDSQTESPVTGTGIKTAVYNEVTGQLEITTSPVVTSIVGAGGLVASTDLDTGIVTLTPSSSGLTGQVESLEPENARLEYIGLHSYLNLVDSAVLPTGIVGKFILPPSITTNNLNLVLFLFGKSTTSSQKAVNFNFEYAVSTPKSLAIATPTLNYTISSLTNPGSNPVSVNLPSATYTANEAFYVTPVGMQIPSTKITGNTVVNFRISRTTSTYTGDIGILGIYWQLGS